MAFLNPVLAIHETAGNGRGIGGRVVQIGKDGTRNCYRAEASVSGACMAHSHHNDRNEAVEWCGKMVEAHLRVHADTEHAE